MFDWFWEFLYGVSKSIYRIIDGMMSCCNMLLGMEPMTYKGEETDFLSFLLQNRNVTLTFVVCVITGVILLFLFGVAAMIKTTISEKSNLTPPQVMVKVGKTLLMYLFIPVVIIVLFWFTNIFMSAIFKASLGGSNATIGSFLAGAFGQDARKAGVPEDYFLREGFDYMNTSKMWSYVDSSDYDYFFSWIAGLCILVSIAQALLMFVDRAISLVILFIVSPISMSTSVVDDGAHFKLWRDQFFVKFLTAYGCILGINIYAVIIGAMTSNDVVFFNSSFLNNLMKIAFMVGGAVSMQRIMALVGNLVSAGAGSNELRDNAIASAKFNSIAGSAARFAGKALLSPFKAVRGITNFANDSRQYGFGSTLANRLGFKTNRDYGGMSKVQKDQMRDRRQTKENLRREGNLELANNIGDRVANAINGGGNNNGNGGNGGNNNHGPGAGQGPNPQVNNAVNRSLHGFNEHNAGSNRPHLPQ